MLFCMFFCYDDIHAWKVDTSPLRLPAENAGRGGEILEVGHQSESFTASPKVFALGIIMAGFYDL